MAAGRKRVYIAKDGEILYGEQRDEYLRNVSDENDFTDGLEMYIKNGCVLHGREAMQEKLADDYRDALKKSGINKWLEKLENEAKAKKCENEKQPENANDRNESTSAEVAKNLSEIHQNLPSKVQNSAVGKTLEIAKDACQKQCDVENSSPVKLVEKVATEVHKKLPSKVKSATGKGLQVAKDVWKTGQDAVKVTTEVIKDSLTGNSADLPEVNVSGSADFSGNVEGHATPLQKTSNRVRVGEAQCRVKLEGRVQGDAQLSSKRSGEKRSIGGVFDTKFSGSAEAVGLDIQTSDHAKEETKKLLKPSATTKREKTYKGKARLEGQAGISVKGASIKFNTSKQPDKPHLTGEAPDLEMNATAQAQATGVNVDIKTTNKPKSEPKSNNDSNKKNSHPKLRMQGKASASATGVDVKVGSKQTVGDESDTATLEAHVHAEATGCEVQIANKFEKPKFKGGSASAKAKATGAAVRLGNIHKSERDDSVSATAEARVAGAELNIGNVSLDKGSSSGVAAVKEVKAGSTAFNFQAGMGGKTGIRFSTDVQFGNVALNLGPPSINISPFAFNLGFGGGIKGSTGTAGKGSAGKEDGSSGGYEDGMGGEKGCGVSTAATTSNSGSNINASNNTSDTCTGNFPTDSENSYNKTRGSGSQFSTSGDHSSTNDHTNISNARNSQNTGDRWHRETGSQWEDATTGDKSGTSASGGFSNAYGYESENNNGLGSGYYNGSDLQDADNFDENSSVTCLEDVPHSSPKYAYSTNITLDPTVDHMSSGQHGNFNHMGADHSTQNHGNTTSNLSEGHNYSSGHERAGNIATNNHSTSATAAAGHHKNKKSKPINSSHPTLSSDLQNGLDGEGSTPIYNPHQLPRRLNESVKSQSNVSPDEHSSQGYQTSKLHHGKYSGDGLLDGAMHPNTRSDAQKKQEESRQLKDDDLSRKISLVLSRSKNSSKKVEKSKTTPTSHQESRQKLVETFTKVREELEAEDAGKSTANDSSDDRSNMMEESKKSTSTSSESTSTRRKSDTMGDQQDIDEVEEVPIPEEKKKPFGSNQNIFTMDSIRASTYKVQKSNKPLQKIGSNVVGFQ